VCVRGCELVCVCMGWCVCMGVRCVHGCELVCSAAILFRYLRVSLCICVCVLCVCVYERVCV